MRTIFYIFSLSCYLSDYYLACSHPPFLPPNLSHTSILLLLLLLFFFLFFSLLLLFSFKQVLVILDNLASLFRDMDLFDEAMDVDAQAEVIATRLIARIDNKKGISFSICMSYKIINIINVIFLLYFLESFIPHLHFIIVIVILFVLLLWDIFTSFLPTLQNGIIQLLDAILILQFNLIPSILTIISYYIIWYKKR